MADEILFQITKEQLDTGLRGIPVGTCVTSHVNPTDGLFYVNTPINALTSWKPEKVIYLLYTGREGSEGEIEAFSQDLRRRGVLTQSTCDMLDKLKGDPIKLFAMALIGWGIAETTGDYREDCLNIIAKVPELVARIINNHAGWKKNAQSDPEKGYMENFAAMLGMPEKPSEQLAAILSLFNVLHYDHGGGNLSTFVGKAVASGMEDMYGSLAAAMCALSGKRHGRANQECFAFVEEVLQKVGNSASYNDVEELIRYKLAHKELIYGFGHAVLRVEDPRATVQYEWAKKYFPDNPLVKTALLIRDAGIKVLKENPKVQNPYPNVDAISGVLLSAAGFPYPAYFPLLFGLSRVVGIGIQIVYERLEAREGKGTPIVRPKFLYKAR